jgi:hypothetical protein
MSAALNRNSRVENDENIEGKSTLASDERMLEGADESSRRNTTPR